MTAPTVLLAPPNTLLRIDRIWLYVTVDAQGNEGVAAASLMGPGSLVPLIAADEARLAALAPIAETIAQATGMRIKLVEFATRTELREISGRRDG